MYLALRDKNCKSVNTCMSTLKCMTEFSPQVSTSKHLSLLSVVSLSSRWSVQSEWKRSFRSSRVPRVGSQFRSCADLGFLHTRFSFCRSVKLDRLDGMHIPESATELSSSDSLSAVTWLFWHRSSVNTVHTILACVIHGTKCHAASNSVVC